MAKEKKVGSDLNEKSNKTKKKIKPNPEALVQAAQKGNLAMLKLLLESGTKPDDRNSASSETALMKAAYYGKLKTLNVLLKAGADIALRDYRGNTAFIQAAWSGHTNVLKKLLTEGADVNEKNKLNWNALMQACVEGHFTTAKFLLENGAKTDEIDKEKGATALTLAKYSGSQKLINLLISYGAKERTIRMRKENEAYFSIFDCAICHYLPHKKDLRRSNSPEDFKGLELIHRKDYQPDRYTDAMDMVKKCTNCGTYYHHDYSYDDEDSFIAGPSISQHFQRYNLYRLKSVLQTIEKNNERKEFEKRYPQIINELQSKLKNTKKIPENFLPYVIESLSDYYLMQNNWKQLKESLLQNANAYIVLDTAKGLVLMYGERYRQGIFPQYTNYRDFTKEIAEKGKDMLNKHLPEFKNCIEQFKNTDNENLKYKYESIISSAKYYKLFEKKA